MQTKIVSQAKLCKGQRDTMFNIMGRYYEGMDRAQFDLDLQEKQDVILLLDTAGQIQGFSTILLRKEKFAGREIIAIFSGDTVLTREFWGNGDLAFAFGRYLVRTRLRNLLKPTYWFLISKGYKTYLLMSNNFSEHWPRFDRPTPGFQKKRLDAFYQQRFNEHYDPSSGILRPHNGKVQAIKVSVADIDQDLLLNPKIRFFADVNPNWTKGFELCCMARVSLQVPLRYFFKFTIKRLAKLLNYKQGTLKSQMQ